MVFIVIAVGVRGPGVEEHLKGNPSERWTFVRSGFFEAIGVISFAFVCHHNSRASRSTIAFVHVPFR